MLSNTDVTNQSHSALDEVHGFGSPAICLAKGGGHEATDTRLAYTPTSQVHGQNSLVVQCFALLHCSANQTSAKYCLGFTRRREVAIGCFLGCLGQLSPSHWCRLGMSHAPGALSALPHGDWYSRPNHWSLSPFAL